MRQRLADDPHVWASALFDEIAALGYSQSYPTFVRKIRNRGLRPLCGACAGTKGRDTAIIDHPPGEECQWDWLELRDTQWGSKAFVLVGVFSFGRFSRLDHIKPGPASSDRGTGRGAATFGGHCSAVACRSDGHCDNPGNWSVTVVVCGGRQALWGGCRSVPTISSSTERGGGKGYPLHLAALVAHPVVVNSLASAQQSLDRFCVMVGDTRPRGEATVGDLADSEPLLELPPLSYPAEGTLARKVAANGLVSVWGNRYSVPPGVIDAEVTVRWRHPHRPGILLQRHHHHPRRRTRHLPAHSLRHSRLEKELRPTPANREPQQPRQRQRRSQRRLVPGTRRSRLQLRTSRSANRSQPTPTQQLRRRRPTRRRTASRHHHQPPPGHHTRCRQRVENPRPTPLTPPGTQRRQPHHAVGFSAPGKPRPGT